ncbi:MAG: hypothetical protein ACLFNU_10910 [Bacteroidales bacterium]
MDVNIKYVKRDDIDTEKWDACIAKSVNGIVYAYTWYLDIVARDWDALVANDYEAVFPLTFNVKFGISYLYQPFFTQQLGLFSIRPITPMLVQDFIKAIPTQFRHIDINFNTFVKLNISSATIVPRITHHLDLIEPYHIISSRYSKNTKRNISKSVAYNVSVIKGIDPSLLLELKIKNQAVPLKKEQVDIARKLITQSIGKGVGDIYAAYTEKNELCAGALFLRSNGKAIYLLASSTTEGKQSRAMFALVDFYIKQNSELPLVLDFEGSSIDSIARFYTGFGASPCNYSRMVINRLPWPLNFLR